MANEEVETWHFSPTDLREVLIGHGAFTEEEADYAMANVEVDWYEEVLEEAAYYLETHETSSPYDMKTTMTGDNWLGHWPEDLVDYALEYYSDSFNDCCLNEAQYYIDTMPISESYLRSMLKEEGFNDDQIDYAVAYCNVDWDYEAGEQASSYISMYPDCTHEELYQFLITTGCTEEQAAAGCTAVGR